MFGIEYNVKATDKEGLTKEQFVDVKPKIDQIAVSTIPAGLDISLDGTVFSSPFVKAGVLGNERVLTASKTQLRNDSLFGIC